jgi:hypothetical protein
LLWSLFALVLAAGWAVVIFAPRLGLGEKYDFVLNRWIDLSRGSAAHALVWLAVIVLCYEILGLGIKALPGRSRVLAVLKSAWADGVVVAGELGRGQQAGNRERRIALALGALFVIALALFLWKSLFWFKMQIDQHWWQALLDYGMDWGAPVFSYGGNLLYGFGIEMPLKGWLLPIEGLAHLFPLSVRIGAAVTLYFAAAAVLFFFIGAIIGLNLVPRTIFAGCTALLLTVPLGLDQVLPFLPPYFFTHQIANALWWGEAPILMLSTVLLFFVIGLRQSLLMNLLFAAGFATGAFAVILAYPVGAVYFIPLLALYCGGIVLTCESRPRRFGPISCSPHTSTTSAGSSCGRLLSQRSPSPPARLRVRCAALRSRRSFANAASLSSRRSIPG